MISSRTVKLALTTLLAVASFARTAHAEPECLNTAAAESLKNSGNGAMVSEHYEEALAAYQQAYDACPNPGLLYNIGSALRYLARYPQALAALERFKVEAPKEMQARAVGLDGLIASVRAKVAALELRINAPGARVLVRKQEVGSTPLTGPVTVNAGAATIEVIAEGYLPFSRDVVLAGGGATTVVTATLASRSTEGILVVTSSVKQARVTIDAKPLGLAPTEAPLRAGAHKVVVERDGYDPASTEVVTVAGTRKTLNLDPIARPALYTRWWFWTGIGAVVAGAVVATIAATTERPAPSGTFSPGVVRLSLPRLVF